MSSNSYEGTLKVEITVVLDRLESQGKAMLAPWITHSICNKHKDGLAQNDDAEFWEFGGYKTCRSMVTRTINQRAGDNPIGEQKQALLPGFEHLQSFYVVDRKGDEVGIPVDLMTDEEIDDKAEMYRKMAGACIGHADELIRYKHLRRSQSAAAE